jgi:dynein heavy chain
MAAQFNPIYLEANSLPPLIEILVDLIDGKVIFVPEVGLVNTTSGDKKTGLKNIVNNWVNGILGISSAFKRVDSSDGTYMREIMESPEVLYQRSRISKFLTETEFKANKLRAIFTKFDYLWKSDLNKIFNDFLTEAVVVEIIAFEAPAASNDASAPTEAKAVSTTTAGDATAEIHAPHGTWSKTNINLEKFGDKIKELLEIQMEVSELRPLHEIDFVKVNAI